MSNKDVDTGLDAVADKVVAAAAAGDKDAWKEIGDRFDGKAAQTVDATIDAGDGLLGVLAGLSKRNDPPVA
jgi:hypothetical protein